MSIFAAERSPIKRIPLASLLGAAAAIAGTILLGPATGAGRIDEPATTEHRVKRGETLAGLAERFYGERDKAEILARVNHLDPRRPLKSGQVLRVPFSAAYRVRDGDTPSRLAERLLGGASRHAVLLELNGLSPRASLAAGKEIEIPVRLEHRLERGETLGEVAKRYYGDATRAEWLVAFNAIDKPESVAAGTRIEVPLVGLLPASTRAARAPETRASAAKSPAAEPKAASASGAEQKAGGEPKSRPDSRPAPGAAKPGSDSMKPAGPPASGARSAEAARAPDPAVQRGVDLYLRGEYRRASEVLDAALESGALPRPERGRALRHRAYCAVALGDLETARRTFRSLRREDPAWKPNPVEDSPKIRKAFSESGPPSSPASASGSSPS